MKPLFLYFSGMGILTGAVIVAAMRLEPLNAYLPEKGREPTVVSGDAASMTGVFGIGYVDVEPGVIAIVPLQAGHVLEVPVVEDQTVEAGDVLLRLDDERARRLVEEAEAAVAVARARLEQAQEGLIRHQADIEILAKSVEAAQQAASAARSQARRAAYQRKHQTGVPSQDVLDARASDREAIAFAQQKRLELLESHTDPMIQVRLAEGELAACEARLAQARRTLDEFTVRAPTEGTVLRVLLGPGDLAGSGSAALYFCPAGPRIVRVEIEQEFAACLEVGQKAMVCDDADGEQHWRGRLVRIGGWYARRRSIAHETVAYQDVRTLECIVELEPDAPPLRIGQRMEVRIETGR